MTHHYRRLTPEAFADLDGATAYQKAASIQAVVVGRPSGDYILDVLGADREGLPGEFKADTLEDLHPSTYGTVAEAEWIDPETGETRRSKVNDVPDGVEPAATDLNPHEWT